MPHTDDAQPPACSRAGGITRGEPMEAYVAPAHRRGMVWTGIRHWLQRCAARSLDAWFAAREQAAAEAKPPRRCARAARHRPRSGGSRRRARRLDARLGGLARGASCCRRVPAFPPAGAFERGALHVADHRAARPAAGADRRRGPGGLRPHAAVLGSLKERGVLRASQSLRTDTEGVRVRVRDGKSTLVDGPFSESKEMVGGYFILDVETREEAVTIAAKSLPPSGRPSRCANSVPASREATMSVFAVIARIRAASGKGDALEALLVEQAGVIRKTEPGCLVYRVHRSTKDPEAVRVLRDLRRRGRLRRAPQVPAPRGVSPATRAGGPARGQRRREGVSRHHRVAARNTSTDTRFGARPSASAAVSMIN